MARRNSSNGNRYKERSKARALNLLRDGVPVAEVAQDKRVGACERTIRRWAHAEGVPLPGGRVFDRDEIRRLFKGRKSVDEVCAAVGCSPRYAERVRDGELV